MAHEGIEDMLEHLRRIKSEGHLTTSVMIKLAEALEILLRLLRTFIKYCHVFLPDSFVEMTRSRTVRLIMGKVVQIPYKYRTICDVERLETLVLEFIEGTTNLRYNCVLNDSDIGDCLGKNLNDVLMLLELHKADENSVLHEKIKEFNPFLKQVKIVQKKMGFLRYLYVMEINGHVDREKLEGLETRIQFMADNVVQFCLGFWVCLFETDSDSEVDEDEDEDDSDDSEEDEDEDEDDSDYSEEDEDDSDDFLSKPPYLLCLMMLVQLEMQEIFLSESRNFKAQKLPKRFSHHLHSLLLSLRNKKVEINFPDNDSARYIDMAVEFLLFFLADTPNHFFNGMMLNEVSENVGAIVGDVLYVIQKLLPSSDTSKINYCSIQILEKTEKVKAQVERYYKSLKFTDSQFPTVGGLTFLDSFLKKLNDMLDSELGLGFMMKPKIDTLQRELASLTSFFKDVRVHRENELIKDLQKRTINLAYEAEVSIDSVLLQYETLRNIFCSLPTIMKEIKQIFMEVSKMRSENLDLKLCSVVEPSKHPPVQHGNFENDEEIVGFESEAKKIIQRLIQGTNKRDVIPIVGMGGQGKTTIARKLYNDHIIVSHFDVRAWSCISQTYNRRYLLKDILNQVTGSKEKEDKEDVLADMLRKRLMDRRYLIVLDDMWDDMVWDDLRQCFPDDRNRSRILLTTRLEKVAAQMHTNPYFLPFLTTNESQELLQKKVFPKEGFPSELQDVSQEVAKKCNGLPLVVVLVAGVLKRKKMEANWWHKVKDYPFSYLSESDEYSLSTMQLSYDNLPDHIRPCLLYMGMFQEDERIPVFKLISQWVAEGFVQNTVSGRLEEEAEGYLMDLISSNMVMVSKRKYNGQVKYCHVHDVVLDFCLKKSREEKFMLAVNGQFQPSVWKENRLRISYTNELPKIAWPGSKTQKSLYPHLRVRSLISTHGNQFSCWNQIGNLRLLKVLDLSCCNTRNFSTVALNPLVLLKYLSVYTENFVFHPELHFPQLETMIIDSIDVYNSVLMPTFFWKMKKLRHVQIDCVVFDLEDNKHWTFEESSKLENLRILSTVKCTSDDVDKLSRMLVQRCPNLQELSIHIYYRSDAEICTFGPKLESLAQLQSLVLFFVSENVSVSELHLPASLKELTLFGSHILPLLGGLPSLEYLEVVTDRGSSSSEERCLGDITFDKLKVLKLDSDISRWDASEESFPMLETLILKQCYKLKEIPPSFADIQTLKRIKLVRCINKSLEDSAEKIKEEVEAIEGCDRIDLIIDI